MQNYSILKFLIIMALHLAASFTQQRRLNKENEKPGLISTFNTLLRYMS